MLMDIEQARLPLSPGRLAHIDLAPQSRLRGVSGQSWITLDNDPRDIVLGPGEEFVASAAGHAIACALRADGCSELLVTA